MERSLFGYIWRHSKREQLAILALVVASLPFYFASLDLPRRIVNEAIQGEAFTDQATAPFLHIQVPFPDWLGGTRVLFAGFDLERLPYLFALSGLFLALVLVNGGFKFRINLAKGALGERMLRRLRFDLFSLLLRFTPESLRGVKSSEAATMIKDEVEPVGGFIGDAYIQPAFLGGQALTALAFIMIQNIWLGLMAGSIVLIQAVLIPYLRREQLRLGKERQLASRRLAGRVGELVDGMPVVHIHDTSRYERAEIGSRLAELFGIRYALFKRKFMVKFLNNLLAQVTPFLFYSIGGYFALMGQIDIGQLVAVIAAYRDLPPPVKDLIDWDQRRQDVEIKFDQVRQQFLPEHLIPAEVLDGEDGTRRLAGPIELRNLRVVDGRGQAILDGLNLDLPGSEHVALTGPGSGGKDALAKVLGRQIWEYQGYVSIAGQSLWTMPEATSGRRLSYAGADPVLFPLSLRDNLTYGLKQRPLRPGAMPREETEERLRLAEARRTGNPVADIRDDWLDYEAAGLTDAEALDRTLIELLDDLGLAGDIYRFGLSGRLDATRHPDLPARMVAARHLLHERLDEQNLAALVETFDPDAFNRNATIGENLLFGVSSTSTFADRNIAQNPMMRRILSEYRLEEPLLRMGMSITETMVEIFSDLPPGHSLFEQFSFISAEDLPMYQALAARGTDRLSSVDRERLIRLPMIYVEPRHRLGLVDNAFAERIVAARHAFRARYAATVSDSVEFYDPDLYCAAAPLKDNLLFGRVAYGVASASDRVTRLIGAVIGELGLSGAVMRIGLDYPVGPQGRQLSSQQRAAIALARCLLKKPDLLVLDAALGPFDAAQSRALLDTIRRHMSGRGLVCVLEEEELAQQFDRVIRLVDGRIAETRVPEKSRNDPEGPPLFREATSLP